MTEVLLGITLVVCVVQMILLVLLLVRRPFDGTGLERAIRDEARHGRDESRESAATLRKELAAALNQASEQSTRTWDSLHTAQREQLSTLGSRLKDLSEVNAKALEGLRQTLDRRLEGITQLNDRKLDEIRRTVDDRLQDSLEKRLGESFQLVSERLEAVHQGLGEMQNLATGVGDLKRVLTNVKARGTWAEVQLAGLLEQVLTAEQFSRNVKVRPDSNEIVEFAIRLPGSKEARDSTVWIPLDSKFPQEDYLRVLEASERGDSAAVSQAVSALAKAIRSAAKDVRDKYVHPPFTTDFAILFLATEGLYAEVLRQPGLAEELQSTYRVVVAGPTTLIAILNSLQMGFRSLAIERRTAEVWRVLGAVKTEFNKFTDVLDKVKRQLETAHRTIDATGVRTRAMQGKLRQVEALPDDESRDLLEIDALVPEKMVEDES